MNNLFKYKGKNKFVKRTVEIFNELFILLGNKYFYIGVISLIAGVLLNFSSQTYLYNYINQGKTLPALSDMILDNLPYWNIGYLYDIFSLVSLLVVIIYIIHRKQYKSIPYFLLLCGIFYLVRGVFIVLTPFGNPPLFEGTGGLFKGFSKFELGVYPSGHAGISYLYFLFPKDRVYSGVLLLCLVIIIGSLLFSRGHYSIDILSGLFFAYAINAFGEKNFSKFRLTRS